MSIVRVRAVKWIKERKFVCQCSLPVHLGILNSGAVTWMGTAQVCLPYTFYVVVVVVVFALLLFFPWLTKPYSDLSHPFLKFIRIYKLAQVISSSPPWRNLKITLHTSVISQIAQNFKI